MVRLMRWMIGLLLTTLSSSFRSQYMNANRAKGKLPAKDDDVGGGHRDPQHPLMYDELKYDFKNQLYSMDDDSAYKGTIPTRHLMQLTENCTPPAIYDFPPDFFTQEQRQKGGVIIHILLAAYACYGLAAVCDIFFVPSLEIISDKLGLSSDVAGATFMAAGTSSPELFESLIGSFVTEGDIGIGTIVGSAVFNILAVTAVCGILTGKIVPLDWWPLSRDCAYYMVAVIVLTVFLADERIYWYEAMVLVIMFCVYVFLMRFNRRFSKFFHSLSCLNRKENRRVINILESNPTMTVGNGDSDIIKQAAVDIVADVIVIAADVDEVAKENGTCTSDVPNDVEAVSNDLLEENKNKSKEDDDYLDDFFSPIRFPEGVIKKVFYIITYPMNLLFFFTIPNCSRPGWRKFFPLTFLMSVVYIGTLSYFAVWMITVMGYTFGIPDTVMGVTFLAIGSSVPEGYSSLIVCKKGMGNMAISNSVGSNVFDILFCLGLPWLIKAAAFTTTGYVQINSSGMVYLSVSLLITVILLYGVIAFYKYQLNVRVGIICLILYALFLAFATMVEMNVFGLFNPPMCDS